MATSPDPAAAPKHELAAIMFSDIAGYTALMGRDEERAMRALDAHRGTLRTLLPEFNGRLMGEIGDGTLSSFHSAIDAVNCARRVQALAAETPELSLRIGIHLGDVVFTNNTVIGDGVNVASRIHALAPPGGICLSGPIYDEVRNKPGITGRSLGRQRLKNVSRPVEVYLISADGSSAALEPEPRGTSLRDERSRLKRLVRIAIAAVVATVAATITGRFLSRIGVAPPMEHSAATHAIRSIAVLPLDNYSGDPNQEYFADGMTDELTTDLSKIRALRVISRGSVMRFKGANRPPAPQIAKELNVDAVVEGSVLRSGNKVRITAQLIDAPADKNLWADTFERDSRDVFALQDELASAIAKQIEVQLTPDEKASLATASTVNPQAHEAYLKGRYFLASWSPEKLNHAIEQFKLAIALDPKFALAYAGLADAYSDADDLYLSPALMPQAKAAAETALRLDNSLAEAHASLGYVRFLYDYDQAGAEKQFKHAIKLAPNLAIAHFYYELVLTYQGRFDEASVEQKKAIEIDPLSSISLVLGSTLPAFQGHYDAARAMVRQALDLDPTSDFAQWQLGLIEVEAGNFKAAIDELEKARRPDAIPYVDGWLGYAYAASGDRDKAAAMIKELDQIATHRYVSPFSTAIIYLGLGDKARAMTRLEKAYQVHSQWLFFLKVDKLFDPLRKEPRFTALMKKAGFPK